MEEEEQPRKRHKPNPEAEENLGREQKLHRLFTKLATQTDEVQIVEGPNLPVAHIPGTNTSGNVLLQELIDLHQSTCLNAVNSQTWKTILTSANSAVDSDCDEQLLINIRFSKPCRLHSLKFRAPDDGHGPRSIKIFTNQNNLDFNNADDIPATQSLTLSPSDFAPDRISLLEPHKFARVDTLSIFVVDNQGDEPLTTIYQIQCIGKPAR